MHKETVKDKTAMSAHTTCFFFAVPIIDERLSMTSNVQVVGSHQRFAEVTFQLLQSGRYKISYLVALQQDKMASNGMPESSITTSRTIKRFQFLNFKQGFTSQ
jgi:hypothetical protein